MKPQHLSLTPRGRAFLAILAEQAIEVSQQADGDDTSTMAQARQVLNDWGFDDEIIARLHEINTTVDDQALLRSFQNKAEAPTLKELFLLINNARRASSNPLSGILNEILKETIVTLTQTGPNASDVASIHVPSVSDQNDRYFLSGDNVDSDYFVNRLEWRFKTLLANFKELPKKPIVLVLGDSLNAEEADSPNELDRVSQILTAYVKSDHCYCSAIVLQLKDGFYEYKPGMAQAIAHGADDGFLQTYKALPQLKVLLNTTLLREEEGQRFSSLTGKELALSDNVTKAASSKRKAEAVAFLEELERRKNASKDLSEQDESVGLQEAGAGKPLTLPKAIVHSLREEENAERVRVIVPVIAIPIVFGLTVGLILGSQHIPALALLPATLASIGSVGASGSLGVCVGLLVAVIGFAIAWTCLNHKYSLLRSQDAGRSDPLLVKEEDEGPHKSTVVTVGDVLQDHNAPKKGEGVSKKAMWLGAATSYGYDTSLKQVDGSKASD